MLGAAGLTKDDVNAVNGSFQDGVDQLKDGKIDAAFTVAGAPTTAIVDYATTTPSTSSPSLTKSSPPFRRPIRS